jgi:uncharacterized protein (UPF0333 family)
VKTVSDRRAKARIAIAFLLLFVVAAALSVGVHYLGKLQENIAGQESRIALEAINNATSIDEALARYPSNRFLKLIAMAAKAAVETNAASEKLSREIEPPALSRNITLTAASRGDLEALRRDLKIAETNATTLMPRYLALLKAEHDSLENDARSLNVEKNVVGRFVESVDRRHAEIAAVISKMLAARADYYRAYDKCVAALLGEFGIYKVTNGQFIFPIQYMADRYNVAANAMTSAATRVAELEEQRKTLAQPPLKGWEPFVGGK